MVKNQEEVFVSVVEFLSLPQSGRLDRRCVCERPRWVTSIVLILVRLYYSLAASVPAVVFSLTYGAIYR